MKRRKFVQLSGMGFAGISVVGNLDKAYGKWGKGMFVSPDIIVVGAGTFGVWTAYHLDQMGAKVALLDAYGAGNSRASSGGETRLIQVDNDNPVYVRSAIRAYSWWKKVEKESGETLVLTTGRLAMSRDEAYRKYALKRQQQLKFLYQFLKPNDHESITFPFSL